MNTENPTGQVSLVTGANTGIGKETALQLARRGDRVFLACRSKEKTLPVVEEIRERSKNDAVEYLHLDLSSFEAVRKCAAMFRAKNIPLHLLINNAGLAGLRDLTEDGFELTFGVNHLGHFLLTRELLGTMTPPARIVNVTSMAHAYTAGIDFDVLREPFQSSRGFPEYCVSKLANVLFTQELSRRLLGTGITTYAVHPGVVATDVWRQMPPALGWLFGKVVKPFMLSVEKGARTTLYCATGQAVGQESGWYYDKCRPKRPAPAALDEAAAQTLWEKSEAWTGAPPMPVLPQRQ